MNCPFCKAVPRREAYLPHHPEPTPKWVCGTVESEEMAGKYIQSIECELRQRLATVTAERDELLKACLESLVVMTMNGSTLVDPTRAIRMASEAIEKARSV